MPTVLCWLTKADLSAYIKEITLGLSGNLILAEYKITGIAMGSIASYKCPTLKVCMQEQFWSPNKVLGNFVV